MTKAEHPQTSFATLLKRSLPRASVEKAKKIFDNFSLSKFPKDSVPPNYVHPSSTAAHLHHAERTLRVQDFQKKKIEAHLYKLKSAEERARKTDSNGTVTGITVALPKDKLHKTLPSYNKDEGSVQLDDLMGLIEKFRRGSEFQAKGDPTLNRVAFSRRVEKLKKDLGLNARGRKHGGRQ